MTNELHYFSERSINVTDPSKHFTFAMGRESKAIGYNSVAFGKSNDEDHYVDISDIDFTY